ncbi:hypothetical protein ACHAWO_010721 [Cyclotella atomus]|uniref:Uncharacterized protein n=1 Tax=Cyclotella atomus TaxID=382360 RepID=A0ABD3NRB3_9STRA
MQAYNIIVDLAYVARPKLYPYFVARWSQFFLKHKIACIYTPAVYVTVAVVLSRDMSSRNVLLGHRIGKNLALLKEETEDTLKDQLNDYFPVLRTKFQIYRNGILDLIGNESSQNHPDESDESIYDKDVAKIIVDP